jgi:ubiquinone/menaquinone biosynthesis C-methylase UbiE
MRLARRLALLLLFSAGLLAGSPAGEIRLLHPEMAASARGAPPTAGLSAALDAAQAREVAAPGGEIDPSLLAGVDCVLLDERSLEPLQRWSEGSVAALAGAVRSGKGLVVVGRAANALPASLEFSNLLGRRPSSGPAETSSGEEIVLEVLDQSHPVTQCVTSLILAGSSPRLKPAAGIATLARATGVGAGVLPRDGGPTPALWTREEGLGRVVVVALSVWAADPGGPGRDEAAIALLVGRSVQWTAGRPVTLRLPPVLPLLAERLYREKSERLLPLATSSGDFYRGRQIAPFMTFHGASWLERADREKTEEPEKVLDCLALREGSTVADLGAGTGYFSSRIARRIGSGGKVLAVEIQEEMLRLLRQRMEKEGIRNVEPVLGTEVDPRLPEGAVDLALMVDVYHELSRPGEVMAAVRRGLREGGNGSSAGRLVLVEYRGEDPAVPIKPLHRMTLEQARAELEPAGFRWLEAKEFLPHQHILIFERRGAEAEGPPGSREQH